MIFILGPPAHRSQLARYHPTSLRLAWTWQVWPSPRHGGWQFLASPHPFSYSSSSTSRGLYQMLCRLALACAHRTHYLWVGCGSSIRHRIWHTLTCIYADSVCAFCMHELVCVCSMLCHRSADRHVCIYAYMYLYT